MIITDVENIPETAISKLLEALQPTTISINNISKYDVKQIFNNIQKNHNEHYEIKGKLKTGLLIETDTLTAVSKPYKDTNKHSIKISSEHYTALTLVNILN